MGEQVVSVRQIDREFRGYHVTGMVTAVWDPEAARRIRETYITQILRQLPATLQVIRNEHDAAD